MSQDNVLTNQKRPRAKLFNSFYGIMSLPDSVLQTQKMDRETKQNVANFQEEVAKEGKNRVYCVLMSVTGLTIKKLY